jgi:hypothetical protein
VATMEEEDPFDSIVQGVDLEEPEDVVDVQKLSDIEVVDMLGDLDASLLNSGNLLRNRTDYVREQHSLRAALLIEMQRRGLRKGN